MEEIVTILSTREWAIAIWGTGFFVWMLTQREIRKSLWNVIKILLGKNLRHFFLIIALYVAGITMIFYQLPFWNNIYLKDKSVPVRDTYQQLKTAQKKKDEVVQYKLGDAVTHPKFGHGIVEKINQRSGGVHLHIRFDGEVKCIDQKWLSRKKYM